MLRESTELQVTMRPNVTEGRFELTSHELDECSLRDISVKTGIEGKGMSDDAK